LGVYVRDVLLGDELDGSLDLRLRVSGRFFLVVCTHPRGGTGHVHPAWWCTLDAPAGARRKGFWWVGGMPRVVCMISMESQRDVVSRGW
jgi:hypothetical protein